MVYLLLYLIINMQMVYRRSWEVCSETDNKISPYGVSCLEVPLYATWQLNRNINKVKIEIRTWGIAMGVKQNFFLFRKFNQILLKTKSQQSIIKIYKTFKIKFTRQDNLFLNETMFIHRRCFVANLNESQKNV